MRRCAQRLRHAVALGRVGSPRFRNVGKNGYPGYAVRPLLRELEERAKEGPAAVLHLLAFHTLRIVILPGTGDKFDPEDVEDYFAKVRQAMVDVMRGEEP